MKSSKTKTLKAVDLVSMDASEESDGSEESMAGHEGIQWPPTPPAHGYPDDAERLPFVLLEPHAYFADRNNATTADCPANGPKLKGSIKVTFCAVAPPLVSYLCFHATEMDHTKFAVEPYIMATETNGSLVLLSVVVGNRPSSVVLSSKREYFIYDPRAGKLEHLPHPGSQHEFSENTLAIVRKCNEHCQRTTSSSSHHVAGDFTLRPHGHGHGAACQEHHHDCSYVVVAQAHRFGHLKTSQLCMYHSDTKTWSKKPVVVNSYPPHHITSKTLTIGGDKGTVAWVDLWRSIIFCDVLDKHPKLRCLELPPPIMPITLGFGDPRSVRDIGVVGDFIKYVDMYAHFNRPSKTSNRWEAATWSIRTGSFSPKDWTKDHHIDSTHIRPQSSLHKLKVDAGITAPTLSILHVGLPNLSLQDDAIVYILAKIDYHDSDHTAWVLAVDMMNQTVKEVEEFSAKRTLGLARGYDASRISAYLKPAPGKQIPKRPGMPLLNYPSKRHVEDDDTMVIFPS